MKMKINQKKKNLTSIHRALVPVADFVLPAPVSSIPQVNQRADLKRLRFRKLAGMQSPIPDALLILYLQ